MISIELAERLEKTWDSLPEKLKPHIAADYLLYFLPEDIKEKCLSGLCEYIERGD